MTYGTELNIERKIDHMPIRKTGEQTCVADATGEGGGVKKGVTTINYLFVGVMDDFDCKSCYQRKR